MAKKVVLAGACRTAIGKMGGGLSKTPAPVLGSIVIEEALKRAGVPKEEVDHVYMGCVIQAGLGQNVARQASIKAGLPIETPAVTVNVVCGSGLNCVNMAAQMIEAGDADIVVAGGMENMSMAPYAMMQGRFGYRMNNGKLVDTMVNDALWDAFNQYHMMITAENVADQWNLTREELDEFPASEKEFTSARELGVSIIDGFTPVAVEGNKVTFKHVRLPGELTMVADKIILAVGQHARLDAFAKLEPQRNTIKTQNYQTRDPQVFAAGDIVEGDKTVVYAVKTGKEAAEAIHHYLEGACSC